MITNKEIKNMIQMQKLNLYDTNAKNMIHNALMDYHFLTQTDKLALHQYAIYY
jgi:hypothetical protein